MNPVTIAVIGATGAVGQEFLNILETRDFPLKNIKLCASHRSAGKRIKVLGEELVVEETTPDSFNGVDIAFISVSTALSGEFGPIAVPRRGPWLSTTAHTSAWTPTCRWWCRRSTEKT